MPGAQQFSHDRAPASSPPAPGLIQPLGMVFQIAGSSSKVMVDPQCLSAFTHDLDPCIAMAGQVGSQVKMRVGERWLLSLIHI